MVASDRLEQIGLDTREYEDDGNVLYLVLGGSYWVYIIVKFTELNTKICAFHCKQILSPQKH